MRSTPEKKGIDMISRKPNTTTAEYETSDRTPATSRSFTTGRQVTQEQIARRAYEIFKSGTGGTPEDNWYRAERELRARA
jgi:hypothetical protein